MKHIASVALLCLVGSYCFLCEATAGGKVVETPSCNGMEPVGAYSRMHTDNNVEPIDRDAHLLSDSARVVREVIVTANQSTREVIPAQTLRGKDLERLSSQSVADAMRYFSGLQVKDYGGVGGIKTVNIRSMGTNHLGVFYDGIQLGNAQNGQTDLGQLSLDNIEEITLYNGQKSAIFQSAADFGNAGSVYIRTKTPQFIGEKTFNFRVRAKYGSSDTFNGSLLFENKWSRKVSSSLSLGVISSSGKYKFRRSQALPDGTIVWDTTATRHNGDILALRFEANLFGQISRGQWAVKAYGYYSERGIPGAIVSNVWRRGERQGDLNTFVQGRIQKSFADGFMTRLQVKYANYRTHYENRDTTRRIIDNTYKQQELYISSSNVYEITPWWSVSAAYDFRWNHLSADVVNFARPRRLSHAVAVATAFDLDRVKIQASMMGEFINDHEQRADTKKSSSAYSPAAFVSWQPLPSPDLQLRAYVKRSFRMPTFNDLYYTDIGNAMLSPERVTQYNVGAAWKHAFSGGFIEILRLKADAYYNKVKDKIVAYPKGQQFRWTMLNLGEVDIRGIDAEAEITLRPARAAAGALGDLTVTARAQYTYQDAKDKSDPRMAYYNDQIPYIPRHSGSATVAVSCRSIDLNYSFIYAGERYNQRENIANNRMKAWYTSDAAISWRFKWGKTNLKLTTEVGNIFDRQYDVIQNYPMPGRTYHVGMQCEL